MTVNQLRKYVTDILGEQATVRGFVASVNQMVERIRNRGQWSFWETQGQIAFPAEYSTGTVEVTDGTALVTGTGVTWTSAMAGRQIRVNGGPEYDILSYSSDVFTLEQNYVGTDTSGVTYAVYQARFALASDLESIIGVWDVTNQREYCVVSPNHHERNQIARMGTARYRTRTVATFGVDSSNNYYLRVDPAPSEAARIVYWYYRQPTAVTGPGSTPDMPTKMHNLLAEGVLARHMRNNRIDGWRDHDLEFRQMLEEQWSRDKPLQLEARLCRADSEDELATILLGRTETLVAL